MSATPVFVASLAALKAQLRLTGATSPDAEALILGAMQKARVGIYDRLGASRVTQIQGMTATDTPSTPDELTRARAINVEISWVRMFLLRAMPTMFRDGSSGIQQSWNEEGIARPTGVSEITIEISRLNTEIEGQIKELSGEDTDNSGINVDVIGPEATNVFPGSQIFP
jgi:hypothetical protein